MCIACELYFPNLKGWRTVLVASRFDAGAVATGAQTDRGVPDADYDWLS